MYVYIHKDMEQWRTLLCYLQERSLAQQCWENGEVPTEASLQLSKPAPSRHPPQTCPEVHPRARGRQQHRPTQPHPGDCATENGLGTQRNTLEDECAETTQNSVAESHRRTKVKESQIPEVHTV